MKKLIIYAIMAAGVFASATAAQAWKRPAKRFGAGVQKASQDFKTKQWYVVSLDDNSFCSLTPTNFDGKAEIVVRKKGIHMIDMPTYSSMAIHDMYVEQRLVERDNAVLKFWNIVSEGTFILTESTLTNILDKVEREPNKETAK